MDERVYSAALEEAMAKTTLEEAQAAKETLKTSSSYSFSCLTLSLSIYRTTFPIFNCFRTRAVF